jgi:hypothetical protein
MELRVHPEVHDLGERAYEPRTAVLLESIAGTDAHLLGPYGDSDLLASVDIAARGDDDALGLAHPHQREAADEVVDSHLENVQRADEVGHEGSRTWPAPPPGRA